MKDTDLVFVQPLTNEILPPTYEKRWLAYKASVSHVMVSIRLYYNCDVWYPDGKHFLSFLFNYA